MSKSSNRLSILPALLLCRSAMHLKTGFLSAIFTVLIDTKVSFSVMKTTRAGEVDSRHWLGCRGCNWQKFVVLGIEDARGWYNLQNHWQCITFNESNRECSVKARTVYLVRRSLGLKIAVLCRRSRVLSNDDPLNVKYRANLSSSFQLILRRIRVQWFDQGC